MALDATYEPKVYRKDGGDRQVVASGGSLDIESGGELDFESGASLLIAGTSVTASAAELNLVDGVTATTLEINQACDVSSLGELLTGTETMTVADNGKRFFLDAAGGFTTKLPALGNVAAGWHCRFIVKAAPSGGTYVITEATSVDTDKIATNGINELEVDTNDDGPSSATHTTLTFADGVAVAGDWIEVDSDGTKWYVTGQTKVDGGITLGA